MLGPIVGIINENALFQPSYSRYYDDRRHGHFLFISVAQ